MLNINIMLIVLRNTYQNENNASSKTLQKHSRLSVPCAEYRSLKDPEAPGVWTIKAIHCVYGDI